MHDWKDQCIHWLEKQVETCEEKARNGKGSSYSTRAYKKALDSVRSHPDPVYDVLELTKLNNVGAKTCALLERKCVSYASKNGISYKVEANGGNLGSDGPKPVRNKRTYKEAIDPESVRGNVYTTSGGALNFVRPTTKPSRREYVPKYGTTAYYMLTCLHTLEEKAPSPGIAKDELVRAVRQQSSSLLDASLGRSIPAATTALQTLQNNDLLYAFDGLYFLDDRGKVLAQRLLGQRVTHKVRGPLEAMGFGQPPSSADSGSNSLAAFPTSREALQASLTSPSVIRSEVWPAGSFKIRLVLDNREVASFHDRHGLQNDIENLGIDIIVESLSVGDCLWVAEHTSGRRAVLHFVVERKTLNDLRSSIHDGRYHEQKSRLQNCGLQNVFYLIEYQNSVANNTLYRDNQAKFATALSQTLVRHNFHLKITKSQTETVQFLASLTKQLQQRFSKDLKVGLPTVSQYHNGKYAEYDGVSFSSFQQALTKSKVRTVGEIFRLMLRTIRGISAEKATAIQNLWPTPKKLSMATPEMLVAQTKSLVRRQQISEKLAKLVCAVWSRNEPDES